MDSIEFHCSACHAKFSIPLQHAGKSAKCAKCGDKIQIPARTQDEEIFDAVLVETNPTLVPVTATLVSATHEPPGQQGMSLHYADQIENSYGQDSAPSFIDGCAEWMFQLDRNPIFRWSMLVIGILLCLTIILFPLGFMLTWYTGKGIIYSYTEEYKRITSYQQAKEKAKQNPMIYLYRTLEWFGVIALGTAIGFPLTLWLLRFHF